MQQFLLMPYDINALYKAANLFLTLSNKNIDTTIDTNFYDDIDTRLKSYSNNFKTIIVTIEKYILIDNNEQNNITIEEIMNFL
jgi:hypothetical protein